MDNDVAELVSGGNQISGTEVEELVSGGNEISGTEVAGARIKAGEEAATGALSLTGATLVALITIGAAHVGVGALLLAGTRRGRRSGYGRPLEGSGR